MDTVPRKKKPADQIDWEARRAFGRRVKQLRDQAGWTTERFADAIGVSRSTLESWMYRPNPPEPEWKHKAKVAEVCGVSLRWLETGEDDGKPRRPGYDTLRADLDKLRGQVARLEGAVRFVRSNGDRITRLEEGHDEMGELLRALGDALDPLIRALQTTSADRRSNAGQPPPGEERRRGDDRRQNGLHTG